MNRAYFGAIHYDIHLEMKLDYTISKIFQEMSLSELETLHQFCELDRTEILQSLSLAVLKIPYAGYLLSGNRSNFIDYKGNILWFYTSTKKVSPLFVFEDKRCYERIPIFYENKVYFVDTLSRRKFFWDTLVPCGSENSHNVVQLNPDEDKYYLLTPYPTAMPQLKKFSPESIRALARNPNIDLQSIVIYSKSDIQHHIRTHELQKILTKMDTIQRQSIDQNLRKPFTSSHQKNVICTAHTTSCRELSKHTPTLIIASFKVIFIVTHHHDNLTTDFNSKIQNTSHRFS